MRKSCPPASRRIGKSFGWMIPGVLGVINNHLSTNDLVALYQCAEQDLRDENITTQIFTMIQSIKQ